MEFDCSYSEKAAIYAIMGKKSEMIDNIKKALDKDKTFRYSLKEWPVFDEYRTDRDFISAVEN